MIKTEQKTVEKLKELIDKNGPDYLTDAPCQAYKELLQSKASDRKTADAILYFLVRGMQKNIVQDTDAESFSALVQKECSLNRRMSDRLTEMFLSLYSQDNKDEWKNKRMEGMDQFLKEDFIFEWDGYSVWEVVNGSVSCYYNAKMILFPTANLVVDDKLSRRLKKNPFMAKEAIHEHFEKLLKEYLDCEFDEYCTCDDYYQPVVEDFEFEYYLKDWSGRNGFEVKSCEGEGREGGYEPSFRRGGYW